VSTRAVAGILLVTAFLVSLVFVSRSSTQVAVRSDDHASAIDVCLPVTEGDAISLVFTNSMFGGFVRETWVVDGGTLRRMAFVTEKAASAEYYAWDAPIEVVDGGYQVGAAPLTLDAIPVLVDAVGQYRLESGGRAIDLSGKVEEPTSVVITVETGSWLTGAC
jgi:hypothetical protein